MEDVKLAWLNIINSCVDLEAGEKIAIIVDRYGDHQELAEALFDVLEELQAEPFLVVLPQPYIDDYHKPLPRGISALLTNVDVAFIITKQSFTHTRAVTLARAYGCRVFSMPGIGKDILIRAGEVDYESLRTRCNSLRGFLNRFYGGSVKITSELGTDLKLEINSLFRTQAGVYKKNTVNVRGEEWRFGVVQNIPAGEVWTIPYNTNGTLIVDGSITHLGKVDEPFRIDFSNGKIVNTDGNGLIYEKFVNMLERSPCLCTVAEFGIGLNDKAIISGNILEDEKVMGTVHIGIGDNVNLGGRNACDYHLDLVITKPTVVVEKDGDEVVIIENGVLYEF